MPIIQEMWRFIKKEVWRFGGFGTKNFCKKWKKRARIKNGISLHSSSYNLFYAYIIKWHCKREELQLNAGFKSFSYFQTLFWVKKNAKVKNEQTSQIHPLLPILPNAISVWGLAVICWSATSAINKIKNKACLKNEHSSYNTKVLAK